MVSKYIFVTLSILLCSCSTVQNSQKDRFKDSTSDVKEREIKLVTRPIPPKPKGSYAYSLLGLAGKMTIKGNCVYFQYKNFNKEPILALMVFPEGAYVENPRQTPIKIKVTDTPKEINIFESQEVMWSAGLFTRSEKHIKIHGCKSRKGYLASHIFKPNVLLQ